MGWSGGYWKQSPHSHTHKHLSRRYYTPIHIELKKHRKTKGKPSAKKRKEVMNNGHSGRGGGDIVRYIHCPLSIASLCFLTKKNLTEKKHTTSMVARGFSNADNISPMGRNLFCHTLSGPSLQYQSTVLQNLDAIALLQMLSIVCSLQFPVSTNVLKAQLR